jgi:hypothetical protein
MKNRTRAPLLAITLLGAGPLSYLVLNFMEDTFPATWLQDRFPPFTVAAIGGAVLLLILAAAFYRRMRVSGLNVRTLGPRPIALSLAALGAYAFCSCLSLNYAVQRLVVLETSTDSEYYPAYVQPWWVKRACANGVAWYDPGSADVLHTCTTFSMFSPGDRASAQRASVVHVLRGKYGVRVISVHAADSESGKRDLGFMKAQGLSK